MRDKTQRKRRTYRSYEQLEQRLPLSCTGFADNSIESGPHLERSATNDSSSLVDVRGFLGWFDRSDFFKIQLQEDSQVNAELRGLSSQLDLRIYNSHLQRVMTSTPESYFSEVAEGPLSAGTYYVGVRTNSFLRVNYALQVDATSIVNPTPVPTPSQPVIVPPRSTSPPSSQPSNPPKTEVTPPANSIDREFPDVAYVGSRNNWNVNSINAPEVWAKGHTGEGVLVAVVDTGVDLDHNDLNANLWVNVDEIAGNGRDDDSNGFIDDVYGWDFAQDDNIPNDQNGHGTHVAGIVASENNAFGGLGVAYDATIMPVQVLNSRGSASSYDVAAGIRYAVDNGADIINLSLGSPTSSRAILSALQYAERHDVFVVAAAGNSSLAVPEYPATYSSTIDTLLSVGAYSKSDVIAGFSNEVGNSRAVQVDAPGVGVYSPYANNRYGSLSGTSMAAPHVAGVAALALSANPELSAEELRQIIVNGTDQQISGSDSHGGINAALTTFLALGGSVENSASGQDNGNSRGLRRPVTYVASQLPIAPTPSPKDSIQPSIAGFDRASQQMSAATYSEKSIAKATTTSPAGSRSHRDQPNLPSAVDIAQSSWKKTTNSNVIFATIDIDSESIDDLMEIGFD